MGLALGANLKFYTSVAVGLKLKVRKLGRPILTFVEVTGEKMGGEAFCPPLLILNRVKTESIAIRNLASARFLSV